MTPAIDALRAARVEFRIHSYTVAGDDWAQDAAQALALAPERVFKTLLAAVGSELVVALVPANATLALKALASAAGGKRALMADPERAERSSGYLRGGISPFGQRRQLRTFADRSIGDHDSVFLSAGRRGLEVELAPDEVIRVCEAQLAALARF
ncbi:MAG: Cys-tRNA(Pro) deacylase [Pseudomonadota bacterium]